MSPKATISDYEADPTVMLEDVSQDIVIKTLKVSCACVPVLVFACECVSQCVCACARRRYVFVRIFIYIFLFMFVCLYTTGKSHRTQVREWMGGWSDKGL